MRSSPKDNERRLFEIADTQGGYFTAKQARAAGYYNRLQHYHRETGDWELIERGVYRLRNYPRSDHEDLIRWSLWSMNRKGESQAVFSHQTALAFHEIGDFNPARIHITVPPGFRKRIAGGCVVHKAVLPATEIEQHAAFKVTTPLRSLFDAYASHVEPDHLEHAIIDALSRGLLRMDQVLEKSASGPVADFLAHVRAVRAKAVHGAPSA
jgi:predicted transcriptional regulator of viral defense system